MSKIIRLTDEELEDLLTELELCGIYGRQIRALAELQERRKATECYPISQPPQQEFECDICGHVSTDPEGRHHCCEDNSND